MTFIQVIGMSHGEQEPMENGRYHDIIRRDIIHHDIHIFSGLIFLKDIGPPFFLVNYACFVKSWETFHSNTNIYGLHFSDMPQVVAFPRWPPLTLKVPHGSKIETCSDFSENSVKLFTLS